MKKKGQQSVKTIICAICVICGLTTHFSLPLLAAVPLHWTVETSRVQPAQFDAVRGETLALEASFNSYGTPLQLPTNAAYALFYQTNGMNSAWWQLPATVTSNRLAATFAPTNDPGASAVHAFLGSTGQIYRAAFTLRFRHGPGSTPNSLPLPAQTIDCAAVTFLNPESAPFSGGSGGCDTNAVLALIAPATNATLSAAKSDASAKYLPLTGGVMTNNAVISFVNYNDNIGYIASGVNAEGVGVLDIVAARELRFNAPWAADISILTTDGSPVLTSNLAARAFAPTSTAVTVASHASQLSQMSQTVSQWENYWSGDKVRLSVTNYYGNTSGELPRLRIEEFDHSTTTTVAGVNYVTNFFKTVWDEHTRHTNYQATVDAKVDAISNTVMTAAYRQTYNQLANKAPRAWGEVTSAGTDAPENTVWHTAPNTVFAGGTEYAHVAVGEGAICVLVDNGAPVYTEGEEGQFRFMDDSGQNYFGFDVRSAYTLGCRTDGIDVDQENHMVTLTYDLTSSTNPEILTCTNLLTGTWSTATVTWEQNPPAGTKVCYIDVGTNPQGFYKAQMSYAGGSKFLTNMQADLQGGIAASNETSHVIQSVYPVITNNVVIWRIKQ